MSVVSDKKRHYKTIDKTCYTAAIIYLVLHIFYLALFIITQFHVLTFVTAGIILMDLSFFLVIRKQKYYLYALLCGNQFLAYVSVTTVMLGFATGFHFFLIGLCVVSFFTTYFSKQKNIKGSLVWVGLSLTIYLTLYFVTKYNAPYYAVPEWMEITLFTTHAIAVFGFVASYLVVFLKYALKLEAKIMNESRTDELTEISNRYGLYDYFELDDNRSNKVLALFDIDDFKNINDSCGHVAGDTILKKVAKITTSVLNDSFVCRYGGEEFVVVIENREGQSAFDRLETLRRAIQEETFEFEGVKLSLTITIGAIEYMKDLTLEKWVELADEKMYSGKKTGKNKTVL